MWSLNGRDKCLRLMLLVINCTACVAIVYIYVMYSGKENTHDISSENFIHSEKLTDMACTEVCNSTACISHANMFLKNINTTADPCEDFRSFLCSGYIASYGANEKANMISSSRNTVLTKLKGILDNIDEVGSQSALSKMKTVYDSCVDYGSSELQGIKDFKNFLNNIGISDWPNLPEDFTFDNIPLPIILGNFITFGTNNVISISQRSGNKTGENSLVVSFSHYTFNRTTKIPRELAVNMLNYFDLEIKEIDTIIEDHELVKKSIMKLAKEYDACNEETCPEFQIDCANKSDDDWREFCETLELSLNSWSIKDAINTNSIIIAKDEDMFFKKLFPLLHSFPNRTLANFIALNLIKTYQVELNFYFRLSKLKLKDFEYEILSEYYELDRWKYCVAWITDNMKLPLQNEFFHQYLTSSVTEEITNIYKDYSSEIIDLIVLQKWISTELKSEITELLKDAIFNIEVISRILPNDTYVNELYEKFFPARKSFFSNVLQLKRFKLSTLLPYQSATSENYILQMTDFDVQATALRPNIDIHYGMLLPPFYIPNYINLMNRALLAIIGHEFGHFIYEMLEYSEEDSENFSEKKQCLRDQFSKFKFEYLNEYLNGSSYDSENVPDNIATTMIDKIVESYSSSEDIILPGLPYSTKQLLYMSSVQTWCAKSNLEKDLHHKTTDPHAPSEFRLLGMMQNSRGYPEAFQCPDRSFMNPEIKCSFLDTSSS